MPLSNLEKCLYDVAHPAVKQLKNKIDQDLIRFFPSEKYPISDLSFWPNCSDFQRKRKC